MKFFSLSFSRGSSKPSDTVRYTVDNSGALTIDPHELVNSAGFRRQIEAAKRLKKAMTANTAEPNNPAGKPKTGP